MCIRRPSQGAPRKTVTVWYIQKAIEAEMGAANLPRRLEKASEEEELEVAFSYEGALRAGAASWADTWRCGSSQRG